MLKVPAIEDLYCYRWNIDIIFCAWRQAANLEKAFNRRDNEGYSDVFGSNLSIIEHKNGII